MWKNIYFRESQRTEEKAAVLDQQLRAEVTTAPKNISQDGWCHV